jgi:hypothetical protein
VLDGDNREAAIGAADARQHPAAKHYWDGEARFALRMAGPLGLTPAETISPRFADPVAWDVYLAYPPGDHDLDRPAHWTHQLRTAKAPTLDPAAFGREIEALLPRT